MAGTTGGGEGSRASHRCLRIVAGAAVAFLPVCAPGAGHAGVARPAAVDRPSTPSPAKLEAIVRGLVAAGAPGAIAVVRAPTGIRRAAAGFARLHPRVRMEATDRYRIASVTKTFVATIVLQLAAEGRLRLGDPVDRWLPGLVPNGRSITLHELLNHTSGLFNYDQDRAWVKSRIVHPGRSWSPQELVAIATSHRPLFPPGTSWSYSSTNYILLGLVIEAVTGTKLERQLHERLFKPLALASTSYPAGTAIEGRVAHGYLGSAPGLPIPAGQLLDVTSILSPSAWGAGQIVSNADDLTRFFAALLEGRLLLAAQLAAMKTRVIGFHDELGVRVEYTANYGLGLRIEHTACGTVYGHDGEVPGYHNIVWATANGRRVAAVMVNIEAMRVSWATIRAAAETALCSG